MIASLPVLAALLSGGEDPDEIVFETRQLDSEFLCEGASFGDLDRDGHGDVFAGAYWYAGPDFAVSHRDYDGKGF